VFPRTGNLYMYHSLLRPNWEHGWPLRLNVYLRTKYCIGPGIQRRRKILFRCGSTSLRTRMCRGCGRQTARKIHDTVVLCEQCTQCRSMRCYMVNRNMASLVTAALLNVRAYESVNCLMDNVQWYRSRTGRGGLAFAVDVCYVAGCSLQAFLRAEHMIFHGP
jgi:hypothetical protein